MKDIVLLHGALGASDQLLPLAEQLKTLSFTPHLFNFSGHGNTPLNSNDFSIEAFSEELIDFIERQKLIQPHIFGYSMGGYIALYTAHKHPTLLNTITTLGTKFKWNSNIAEKETAMLNPNTIQSKVPQYAQALKNRHGENKWTLLLERTANLMGSLGSDNVLTESILQAIKQKALIGIGDKDSMVSLEETVETYKLLQNSSMYMLPNTKHPIESVNTINLASLLNQFCN